MRPVSATFLNALDGSAVYTARARVIDPSTRGGSGEFNLVGPPLPILGGTVVLDATADQRTRVEGLQVGSLWPDVGQDPLGGYGQFSYTSSYNFPGKEVWPKPDPTVNPPVYAWRRRLSPHGNLLRIEAGVELGNGNVEYVRVATVRIDAVRQDDAPGGPIDVDCSDLEAFLDDVGIDFDRTFQAGTTMAQVFAALVPYKDNPDRYRYGIVWSTPVDLDLDPTFAAMTLEAPASTSGDRTAFLRDLCTSRGYDMWWDARPKLVVREKLDTAADVNPVWDFDAGSSGNSSRIGRELTRDGVYTIVVADGDAASDSPPVRSAIANQGDSSSYWPYFGMVMRRHSSTFYTTTAQAESGARAIMASQSGVPYRVDVDHVTNPALEPRDPVRVWVYGREDPLRFETHIIQTTSIPLLGGTQQSVMREVGL